MKEVVSHLVRAAVMSRLHLLTSSKYTKDEPFYDEERRELQSFLDKTTSQEFDNKAKVC